jgi:hypothetical protein
MQPLIKASAGYLFGLPPFPDSCPEAIPSPPSHNSQYLLPHFQSLGNHSSFGAAKDADLALGLLPPLSELGTSSELGVGAPIGLSSRSNTGTHSRTNTAKVFGKVFIYSTNSPIRKGFSVLVPFSG